MLEGRVSVEERLRDVCLGCSGVRSGGGGGGEGVGVSVRKDGSVTFSSDEAVLAPLAPVSTEQICKRWNENWRVLAELFKRLKRAG